MTAVAGRRSRPDPRSGALVAAGAAALAVLVPPVVTEARRLEVAQAAQFVVLAVAVPALVVLGAPWHRLGLASGPGTVGDGEDSTGPGRPRLLDTVAGARRRHRGAGRALGFLAVEVAAVVGWRSKAAVDALAAHGWLVGVEALTLAVAGVGLWLELVVSPPLVPRLSRPMRIALAAVAMWTVWVTAYLVGLAHGQAYPAFHHAAGRGLSVFADQAVTTGVLWFGSLCAFVPVVFANLVQWLRAEEDPDEALHRLLHHERRRGAPPLPRAGGA
ncbi:MAG TPA: cytochrome c oxidase assembly protein [Acidimicrobiales bacterium]|nr:cytochrome c oxidase assembly protein [Acidimicrobiales bacterium]